MKHSSEILKNCPGRYVGNDGMVSESGYKSGWSRGVGNGFIFRLWILIVAVCLNVPVMQCQTVPVTGGEGEETFRLSRARKAVGTSTDIALMAMPVATLAGVLIARDWTGLKQAALSGVTSVGAMVLLKYTIREKRPDGSSYNSFPSGHSSSIFTNATFLQRRYGWKFGVPAYVVATYVGWGRIYAKKHHWWDVVAGAAIGAGASLIYTRPFAEKHDLIIEPSAGPGGVSVSASLVF